MIRVTFVIQVSTIVCGLNKIKGGIQCGASMRVESTDVFEESGLSRSCVKYSANLIYDYNIYIFV